MKKGAVVRTTPFFQVPTGFEPVHRGFADLSLTTWVRHRRNSEDSRKASEVQPRKQQSFDSFSSALCQEMISQLESICILLD